jgi:voltage-gated potassium channel Kch
MVERPEEIVTVVVLLIALKFLVLIIVAWQLGIEKSQGFLFAFALAQGGEFCFVLLSTATQQGLFAPATAKTLVASVALSMMCAPVLFTINEKLIQPRFRPRRAAREPDVIDEHDNPVILAGFGRFGHVIGRLLRAHGFPTTILDNDPDQVSMLAQFGLKSFYGDASRLDLLHAAGAEKSRLFILAIDDEDRSLEIVKTLQQHFPNLRIMARAVSRQHAYELIRLGVEEVYRDTFGSALDLGGDALRALGFEGPQAQRAVQIFKERDDCAVHELAKFEGDQKEYISRARQHIENLERLLQSDLQTTERATESTAKEPV